MPDKKLYGGRLDSCCCCCCVCCCNRFELESLLGDIAPAAVGGVLDDVIISWRTIRMMSVLELDSIMTVVCCCCCWDEGESESEGGCSYADNLNREVMLDDGYV